MRFWSEAFWYSSKVPLMKVWRSMRALPRELWILSCATFINRLGTMVLPFLLVYLTRHLGFTATSAGSILAVYGGVAIIAGPISGRLCDRVGALVMMEGSLVASTGVLLVFPLFRSWGAVVVMTMLFSAANEGFRPASMAVVASLGPGEHRKAAYSLNRWAATLGMSAGPALGGLLAQVSFSLLFAVDGLTALLAVSVMFFSPLHGAVRAQEKRVLGTARASASGGRRGLFDAFLRDGNLRVFLLGILPVVMVFFQSQSTMSLFVIRDLHFSETAYGMLFSVNALMVLVLELPLNAATARWTHRRTLAMGSLLVALGFGALTLAHSYTEVVGTVVVWTFGEMILLPGMAAYVSEVGHLERRGEYFGLFSMTFNTAFLTGPFMGTLVFEHWGATVLWPGALAVGLVSVVVLGLLRSLPARSLLPGH